MRITWELHDRIDNMNLAGNDTSNNTNLIVKSIVITTILAENYTCHNTNLAVKCIMNTLNDYCDTCCQVSYCAFPPDLESGMHAAILILIWNIRTITNTNSNVRLASYINPNVMTCRWPAVWPPRDHRILLLLAHLGGRHDQGRNWQALRKLCV
jgi:hypothetical protein